MRKLYTKEFQNKRVMEIYYNKMIQNEKIKFVWKGYSLEYRCYVIRYGF
jgi:hypothetical protein